MNRYLPLLSPQRELLLYAYYGEKTITFIGDLQSCQLRPGWRKLHNNLHGAVIYRNTCYCEPFIQPGSTVVCGVIAVGCGGVCRQPICGDLVQIQTQILPDSRAQDVGWHSLTWLSEKSNAFFSVDNESEATAEAVPDGINPMVITIAIARHRNFFFAAVSSLCFQMFLMLKLLQRYCYCQRYLVVVKNVLLYKNQCLENRSRYSGNIS